MANPSHVPSGAPPDARPPNTAVLASTTEPMHETSTIELLATVDALLDRIDHERRANLKPADRLKLVTIGRRVSRRLDALVGVLVAEADAANASMVATGTPMTSWLMCAGQTSQNEAHSMVFAGRDVAAHPAVRAAALAGAIGVRQARSIRKVLNELPADLDDCQRALAQDLLLEAAVDQLANRLATMTQQILTKVSAEHAAATQEAELKRLEAQRERAMLRRSLRFSSDGDGSTLFSGSLPAVEGARFVKLIDAYVESDRRRGREQGDRLAEQRSGGQRRADALLTLISDHETGVRGPSVASDRPRIVVTMSEQDLRLRAEAAGVLETGVAISAGELRRLCCDADLVPAVLGTRSELLDIGRASRLVSSGLRRALSIRDGGCVFPGCELPDARCEAHHIVPWWMGGRTALWNLVLLCPHHHHLVEPPRFWQGPPPDRWQVRLDQHGLPELVPPARIDPDRKPIPGNRPAGLPQAG